MEGEEEMGEERGMEVVVAEGRGREDAGLVEVDLSIDSRNIFS